MPQDNQTPANAITTAFQTAAAPLSDRAPVNDSLNALREAVSEASSQLFTLQSSSNQNTAALSNNTNAVAANTAAQSAKSGLSEAGKTALSYFTSGLGFSPLVSGLISAFRGSSSKVEEPLIRYAPPPSVSYEYQINSGQNGSPPPSEASAPAGPANSPSSSSSDTQGIKIEVRALDSRSFLDHSQEIADALRQAILSQHSINDLIGEL